LNIHAAPPWSDRVTIPPLLSRSLGRWPHASFFRPRDTLEICSSVHMCGMHNSVKLVSSIYLFFSFPRWLLQVNMLSTELHYYGTEPIYYRGTRTKGFVTWWDFFFLLHETNSEHKNRPHLESSMYT
jgi:hypothetical protein